MAREHASSLPSAGTVVVYRGRSHKSERNVRVIAEASGGRMVVEAIGRQGVPPRHRRDRRAHRLRRRPRPQALAAGA